MVVVVLLGGNGTIFGPSKTVSLLFFWMFCYRVTTTTFDHWKRWTYLSFYEDIILFAIITFEYFRINTCSNSADYINIIEFSTVPVDATKFEFLMFRQECVLQFLQGSMRIMTLWHLWIKMSYLNLSFSFWKQNKTFSLRHGLLFGSWVTYLVFVFLHLIVFVCLKPWTVFIY